MAMKSKTTMPTQNKSTKARRIVANTTVPTTKSGSQKQRELITAAGGRQLNVLLKPVPNRALARLMKHYRLPAVQVVAGLLTDTAAQLRKPGKSVKSAAARTIPKTTQSQYAASRCTNKVTAATKGRRKNAGTV